MRKPYPLHLDLFALILLAATEPQRNLHFPLFRSSRTRLLSTRSRRRGVAHMPNGQTAAGVIVLPPRVLECDDVSQLRAAADAQRPDRALPASPQMEMF